MGVYIKGMEMPTNCHECRLYEGDIYYCSAADKELDISDSSAERCKFCPLIEIPPHGRLIDADALIKELTLDDEDDNSGASLLMAIFLEVLKAAPTIIPAEEGE